MVFATSVERNAPTRFKVPAAITAVFGFRAPVAIEVAMALAVSWKPFVKSNVRATTITRPTTTRVAISMLFFFLLLMDFHLVLNEARSHHAQPVRFSNFPIGNNH